MAIARDAIQREMQHHPAEKPIAAWQRAARALVIRELLLQRARHLGIAAEPLGDGDGRRETDEEAVMRAVVEREVTVPQPDDETCRRYYARNQARFRSPDIYEASHILFAALPGDRTAYAQARADAAAVLATLQDNPDSFATLARAYSRCPSGAQGGNLGQITPGQTTPEFEQAISALSPGELCAEPVATRYGFHVIRLDRKHEGVRCLMKPWPNASRIICARACGAAPTPNMSRGLSRRPRSKESIWPAPRPCGCIEARHMMLGDILAGLADDAQATELILGLDDLQLLPGFGPGPSARASIWRASRARPCCAMPRKPLMKNGSR